MVVNYKTMIQCVTANQAEADFAITKYKLIRDKLSSRAFILYFLSLKHDEVLDFLTKDLDIDLHDYQHPQELKLLNHVISYVRSTSYDILRKTFPKTFNPSKSLIDCMNALGELYMVNKVLDHGYSRNIIKVASDVLDSLLFNRDSRDSHTLTYGYFTTPEESKQGSITLRLEVIEKPSNGTNPKAKYKDSVVAYINAIKESIKERNPDFLRDLCDPAISRRKYEKDIIKAIISCIEYKRAHGYFKNLDVDLGISKPVFLLEFIFLIYKYRNVTIEAYKRFSLLANVIFDILKDIELDIDIQEDKIIVTVDKMELCYNAKTGRKLN